MNENEDPQETAELLILPDGRILGHNLSPTVAVVLAELNPDDPLMKARAQAGLSQNQS